MSDNKQLDFREFRSRIGDLRGKDYWRSLEELSRSDEFDRFFTEEFPQQAHPLAGGFDRRDFMKLMGASVALGGLAACQQAKSIVPYVKQPEGLIPGKPLFFASAMPFAGYGQGVLVESHMGRPTKIEGNPDHPSSIGATTVHTQASVLGLYDPDRSPVVRHLGETSTWSEFIGALQAPLQKAQKNGAGFRILTQTVTSPTLGAQIQQFLKQNPGAMWHQWEPVNADNEREGARMAFGSYVNAQYHFEKANVVLSLDSDFMGEGPAQLRYSRDFMSRRKVRKGKISSMNRLYVLESGPSCTGSVADHRFAVKPSEVETFARAIATGLGLAGGATANASWIAPLVRDLQANRGSSVVIAGPEQPPVVHAIAWAMNQALGNVGSTITITDPVEVAPTNQLESLRQLVTDMKAGKVETLIVLGGNPVFDAPADFGFAEGYDKVPFRAHLSQHYDETSNRSHWHIPETHYLESWGDVRAHDGTVSIVQPLIAPLYNGRAPIEVLGAMLGGMDAVPYDTVRAYWKAKTPSLDFESTWRKWLNDGFIANSALPARSGAASTTIPAMQARPGSNGLELRITYDPNVYDGRFANNGWLQELPKPQTKIVWENVILVGPKTGREILKASGTEVAAAVNEKETWVVNLHYRGQTVKMPIWMMPGHAEGVATVFFGYGRKMGGIIATGKREFIEDDFKGEPVGVDVYPIRFSDALCGAPGATITPARGGYRVGCTQEHQAIDHGVDAGDTEGERRIIRAATFAEYQKNPDFARDVPEKVKQESIWGEPWSYPPKTENGAERYRWAMSIDTTVCIGCQGCVIACQSENNIPIVGKNQVWREREMHWLRIDRYFSGDEENPEVFYQPVPCMQCENAPCEPVCPVGATAHSIDGLNDMTYNRCVGTRYCSNNCPYKVRRFNFYHYSDYDTEAYKAMRNPDVTVRTRGIMEKCTYCVQRINSAKITAEKENRRVKDGEIVTACQQACPTDAIVFGDLDDKDSEVSKLKMEPTDYALVGELNTRPRTTYLASVRNPNPEIKAE